MKPKVLREGMPERQLRPSQPLPRRLPLHPRLSCVQPRDRSISELSLSAMVCFFTCSTSQPVLEKTLEQCCHPNLQAAYTHTLVMSACARDCGTWQQNTETKQAQKATVNIHCPQLTRNFCNRTQSALSQSLPAPCLERPRRQNCLALQQHIINAAQTCTASIRAI